MIVFSYAMDWIIVRVDDYIVHNWQENNYDTNS